jgi:hypothetical protein
VDTYLAIAEKVIRATRRSLSALEILQAAYKAGIAPRHLRGKTQHKTLQARLSEDILHGREGSKFYRTAPGRFFLREFLEDSSIPLQDRTPIVARRRRRELPVARPLALSGSAAARLAKAKRAEHPRALLHVLERGGFHYAPSSRRRRVDDVLVWSFVIVVRHRAILTYRQGSYREDRDPFLLRRTVGFYTPVTDLDRGLFDQEDHGIVTSGLRALAADLDLEPRAHWKMLEEGSSLVSFILPEPQEGASDLLALVAFECPSWLEPLTRRLAIHDLAWLDLDTPPNHLEDFDPWSQAVLAETRRLATTGLPKREWERG